jgi:hypothetical protein
MSDVEYVERLIKAEGSDKNRRNGVADTTRSEKRPGKEALLNADGDKRIAKGPDARDRKVTDTRSAQKRPVVETSKHQAKVATEKAAKAKSGVHFADQPEAFDKKL